MTRLQETTFGYIEMRSGIGNNIQGIGSCNKLFGIGIAFYLVLGNGGGGIIVIGVKKAYQDDARYFQPLLYMNFTEMSGSENAYF